MTECTLKTMAEKKVLIAAHRGVWGGNVAPNTMEAFEAALAQGADIVELDVLRTADNRLVVFHSGMEKFHLGRNINLKSLSEKEVLSIPYINIDGVETEQTIQSFDNVLRRLKGRCFLNIDRGWADLDLVTEEVERHGMQDQILLKSPADVKYFRAVERYAPEYMYMPIIKEKDRYLKTLESMHINCVGAELVFQEEVSPVVDDTYIRSMHESGYLLWGNGIVYNYRSKLSAGHNDDISLLGDPEEGWGYLCRKGFDIIQTDWPCLLKQYLENQQETRKENSNV